MEPFEVIAYEGTTVIYRDIIIAENGRTATFVAGTRLPSDTLFETADLRVEVRPFGGKK